MRQYPLNMYLWPITRSRSPHNALHSPSYMHTCALVLLVYTAAYIIISTPDSLPKGGRRVWYSCIQKAIMGYSLREDWKWGSQGCASGSLSLHFSQFIAKCGVPQLHSNQIHTSEIPWTANYFVCNCVRLLLPLCVGCLILRLHT